MPHPLWLSVLAFDLPCFPAWPHPWICSLPCLLLVDLSFPAWICAGLSICHCSAEQLFHQAPPRLQFMSDQDLAFRVQLLEEQVEELRRLVEGLRFPQHSAVTTGSYTVVHPVSSRPQSESGSAVSRPLSSNGDYNTLAEQIPVIPDYLVRSCTNLTGGTLGFRARAVRAWEAGWWAKFCLRGQLSKPRPTKPIDLANSCYIILRAEGYVCPILVHRASDYRFILQDFKTQSISHGFPSLAEAKVYCSAAEVEFPASAYTWSPTQ